jgi:2-amino-4-hydroxy-6-hydroxymethyldihydropteridine diphosphokinase
MKRYVISIGANLADARTAVAQAAERLAERLGGSQVAVSSLYRTSPVGGPMQPDFVNAVVIVETNLTPHQVLRVLQVMEQEADRVRDVRWGPRTLDLDVIAAWEDGNDVSSGVRSDDPHLTLPHPRAHERAFVLVPWLEIDPDATIVGKGTVRDLLVDGFPDQYVTVN